MNLSHFFLFRTDANDTGRSGTSLQSKVYFHSQIPDFTQLNISGTIVIFQYDTEQKQNYLDGRPAWSGHLF